MTKRKVSNFLQRRFGCERFFTSVFHFVRRKQSQVISTYREVQSSLRNPNQFLLPKLSEKFWAKGGTSVYFRHKDLCDYFVMYKFKITYPFRTILLCRKHDWNRFYKLENFITYVHKRILPKNMFNNKLQ